MEVNSSTRSIDFDSILNLGEDQIGAIKKASLDEINKGVVLDNSLLYAGYGSDELFLFGDILNSHIYLGSEMIQLVWRRRNAVVWGENGNDTLKGGSGDDRSTEGLEMTFSMEDLVMM